MDYQAAPGGALTGRLRVAGDKSISHRSVMLGSLADGVSKDGYFVAPALFGAVPRDHRLACKEVFGPVLNVMHMEDLDAAIELANKSPYGNGASIFTRNGKAAREFKHRVNCGMIGINIGVPGSGIAVLTEKLIEANRLDVRQLDVARLGIVRGGGERGFGECVKRPPLPQHRSP